MSRVGKNPVAVLQGVECHIDGNILHAKGKNGFLSMNISPNVTISIKDDKIYVNPAHQSKQARMMWGTTRRLVNNLIQGVNSDFTKKLEINGTGYRASIQDNSLILQLGYSHDIHYPIPKDVKIVAEKPTLLVISGSSKQRIGQVAAEIRNYRLPEPYKGKGIKYDNENILRKEGKKK